jgi:hypothetical protein
MPRQFLVPGYGYIDDRENNKQFLVPGVGYLDQINRTSVTNQYKESAFAQDTGECYFVLLTISHADLAAPIRVVNNNEAIISNSNTFLAFPFKARLPDSKGDSPPRAQVVIDNTDQQLATAIRTISSKATVLPQVIRGADPDTIERTYATFDMRNATWDASSMTFDLVLEDVETEPFPAGSFTPAEFPGLFKTI